MNTLFVIPARGGSKGLPGKNIKPLGGKPLIHYAIDLARKFADDQNICVSTDSEEILNVAESSGLKVPFIRPSELATDTANSRDVILHALHFFQKDTLIKYDSIVLLQPTSPFRSAKDLEIMLKLFDSSLDMVVSVKESHNNPYFSLFEENSEGFLQLSKPGNFTRRQDAPRVYGYNGAIYVINPKSLEKLTFSEFPRIRKHVMSEIDSIDIDTQFDWWIAEMVVEKSLWSDI